MGLFIITSNLQNNILNIFIYTLIFGEKIRVHKEISLKPLPKGENSITKNDVFIIYSGNKEKC